MTEKAQVGDLIRVIDESEAYGAYVIGDILEVEKIDGDLVYVKERYFGNDELPIGGDKAYLTGYEYVIHRKASEEDETTVTIEIEEPIEYATISGYLPHEETQADRIKHAGTELTELLVRKNHDYGDSFAKQYEKYGLMSALIRMDDKMRRLETLLSGADAQVDESIKETLIDLAGYATLAYVEEMKRHD